MGKILLSLSLIALLLPLAALPAAIPLAAGADVEPRAPVLPEASSAAEPEDEVVDFTVYAPYWSTEPGFVSTLQMKNYRVDEPLTVTPVLYPMGGQEIRLAAVRLRPSETRVLNLNDALAAVGEPPTVGAVEIRYQHVTEGVFGANLSVINETDSVSSSFPLRAPQPTRRLEGVWWFWDADTDGFVAVHNTSRIGLTVTPTLYVAGSAYPLSPLRLRAQEMRLIRLRSELSQLGLETASEGGIQLESSMLGAVMASGWLINRAIGFSSEIRLGDPRLEAERPEGAKRGPDAACAERVDRDAFTGVGVARRDGLPTDPDRAECGRRDDPGSARVHVSSGRDTQGLGSAFGAVTTAAGGAGGVGVLLAVGANSSGGDVGQFGDQLRRERGLVSGSRQQCG